MIKVQMLMRLIASRAQGETKLIYKLKEDQSNQELNLNLKWKNKMSVKGRLLRFDKFN